jgi:N-acetylneuraminic acid mutarotase
MRRIWAVCAALVLLAGWGAGCSGPPASDQGEIKQAFIRQLVGFCAEVDRQLAKIDMKGQPGIVADQFARFVGQARSQPAPDADRAQFEILLTEIDGVVRDFRSAQTALTADDQPAYQEALTQADQQLGSADSAAQKYGMPPLNSCPEHESTASASAPSPSATPAPAAAWQLRHESLEAVQQVGAAVLDGRIWVAGGLTTPTQATASTQFYDPTIDTWESGPPLPEAVHHAMLVTYRNQLVLIGGFLPRGDDLLAVTSPRVLFFDGSAGRWVEGPPLHHPRAAAAAAVVGDKIVVVGGRTGHPEQLVGQTEVFDGNAWHDGADIPVPGDHLAAAADPAYLYAVGGRKFTAGNNTDAVQRYEPATDQWTTLAAMPKPVSGAGAAIIDGRLLVAGGESTTTVSSTVQAYDLTAPTATWTTLPSLTQGRHGLAVTAIGNTLYAIAGSTRAGHTASTSTVGALTFS